MKKQFNVGSSKLKVNTKVLLHLLVFSLFTFHFLLFTSYADEIHSKAAVVMEASTGRILYAKNPNLRLLPASTTKLMTAIIVIENSDLTENVSISKNASQVAPLKAGFKEGDKVTVETLLYAALLKSANDAAVALAEAVAGSEERFVHLMNSKTIALGLEDTKFINAHGLPGPHQYTTALDLSKIMKCALRYPKLKEIMGTRVTEVSTENGNAIFLKNTNRLLWSDEELIGGKTGYTRKARHCFVCASERDNDMVIVTLLGNPSRDGLWKESETLIGKGFQIMANKEEPVIYFTKADYDVFKIKKAPNKKSLKIKNKSSKIKRKTKLVKKKNTKTVAQGKSKKRKDYKVAKKNGNGNKG
ncbi:MAG: D-alanyl-D-alanine carboxypeptidase [Nitrospirota bacterium]|nr:D-alanyl-D-alanine carboxypeptidase [Nitrospirota bacterium]MDH5768102.1 D-alanyl-D-alanine carboxypeptidase [Nitrospirota bacterium]